ncbi:hypothetical protein IWW34DRAFT_397096 [Fusarium oxysporum f. sp. albedinis]|uniref:Uncharacterized protein n=5 Tax=Fusarium oxysporum TaxID=5507 RepID=A0A2H3GSH7_FUSOX|nr:uncharacterized protein FOBCDRAFT_47720 [Fusarium oxysporum Fo47]EWZ95157.1 hypothetical protein FOWG_05167 [Fusarium oxysporum f. sp. lycopersici MN25]KAH7475381.1 hypothetical protein FOMA001_g11235 [Fusarium oxysporum f. sp. matthiolae]KAI3581174.1 hypothetical protein IWW34DRAFT_397096 [Fusarium oxysporum f. sp. albedinis]KAJ4110385.1 hypothetical protein NW765_014710 [Fusarium oxysporum]PCD30808.1 hypothetical protein AU210_010481 [Fusarium oxysporum f. sp. radicis-cucumerinum]RKK1441
MQPLDPQGLVEDRAAEEEHGQFPIEYHSRLTGPSSQASYGSSVRASTARRRAAVTNKPRNNNLSETTSLRLSPAALKTPSAAQSTPRSSPPLAPLSVTPPTTAHHPPSSSVRTRDPGLHVEPTSPKLQSPLRHSINSADNNLDVESQFYKISSSQPRPLSVDMSFTGDKRPAASKTRSSLPAVVEEAPRNGFSTWFNRSNAPSPLSTTAAEPRRRSTSSAKPSTPTSSRFNFFGSLTASPTACPSEEQNEALMNLDIEKGLFPNGLPVEGTAFSPSAFKNLQMNATGLLSKFQAAYEQRTTEFRELQAERDIQNFNKSEAEIRVQQLEKQLEEQAILMAERDAMIEYLLNRLANEKDRADEATNGEKENITSAASIVSEDLGVDEDRLKRWRKSTSTSSDDESVDEASVFSRSRSPTICTNISEISPVTQPKPVTLEPPRATGNAAARNTNNTQMGAFQKLIRGMSSEKPKPAPATCLNCQGQTASMAWDTVSLLKDENKGLKVRVEELETAVEGALDAVNGLGL